MPKRETVLIDAAKVSELIKTKCRHNVIFCEAMGKHATWVTDWKRKVPKNLPSPEEAARMTFILGVLPEDILPKQEDVDKVKVLIQREAEKSAAVLVDGLMFKQKEEPTPVSESGQIHNYELLSEENRAMIDGLIAKLLASQSDGQQ